MLHIMEAGALNVRSLGRCEIPLALMQAGFCRGNIKMTGADIGESHRDV